MVIGKYKLKPQIHTTTEWVMLERPIVLKVGKDEEQTESSYVSSRNVIGTTALQNCLAIANVKHTPTVWPKHFITGSIPTGNKCNVHKNICTKMFPVALLVTVQIWKPPKCFSIDYNIIMYSCFVLSNIAIQ